jgi:hypothetical protein
MFKRTLPAIRWCAIGLLATAGIPIIAQENARNRLPAYPPASGKAPTPIITYDRDYTL